jgi:hypothetical protein
VLIFKKSTRPSHQISTISKKKQPRFLTLVTPACHGLSPSPPGQSATPNARRRHTAKAKAKLDTTNKITS